MAEFLTLGGPRMDALAESTADEFDEVIRAKLNLVLRLPDLSFAEGYGLLLRMDLCSAVATIRQVADRRGVSIAQVRDLFVDELDSRLAEAAPSLFQQTTGGNA